MTTRMFDARVDAASRRSLRTLLCGVILLLAAAACPQPARAQSTPDGEPWDLYWRHSYHDVLRELPRGDSYLRALAYMRLGLIYSELDEVMAPVSADYLNILHTLSLRDDARSDGGYIPYYLALAVRDQGDPARAAELLEAFLAAPPPAWPEASGYASSTLGSCLYDLGRHADADERFGDAALVAARNPHVAAHLALEWHRLGIRDEETADLIGGGVLRSEEWVDGVPGSHERRALMLSLDGQHDAAVAALESAHGGKWRPGPESVDESAANRRVEFFAPRMFRDVSDVYMRAALGVFARLEDEEPAHDIAFARPLLLHRLGRHAEVIALLQTEKWPEDIAPAAAAMLGASYHAQGLDAEAMRVWEAIDVGAPNSAVGLAMAYARAEAEPTRAAALIAGAMDSLLALTDGKHITDEYPVEYRPLSAFDPREVYRRAAKTILRVYLFAPEEVDVTRLGMRPETRLIDYAKDLSLRGRHLRRPYAVDDVAYGNDPLMLIDVGYLAYERGFDHWGEATEVYSVLQGYLPEAYPLHTMIQLIYATQLNLHEDARGRERE